MNVLIFDNQEEASKKALDIFKEAIDKGAKTFGLATGSTPEKLYELMIESDIDFSDSTSINLDEYYGLADDHPQSYHYFMEKHLFSKKPFKETFIPDGLNEDAEAETKRFDEIIANHPIDLQLLGVGPNGHIGFNEPGTDFSIKTHLADLTVDTIKANSRFFDSIDQVPTKAYSMGIGSIMDSKEILFIAFGENKAAAVKGMLEGPVTEELPASVLQKHPNVTLIIDQAAASQLEKDY
ncbi:glucosamine-6-phosphate deaminase [Hutsoniella sourekii]